MHNFISPFIEHFSNILNSPSLKVPKLPDTTVVGNFCWKVGGHLVATVQHLLVLLAKPGAGHRVLLCVPLHGLQIEIVAGVNGVGLPENTGQVADLGFHLVLLLGKLLNEPVSKVEVVSGLPLRPVRVEHLLELRHWVVLPVSSCPVVVGGAHALEELGHVVIVLVV